MVDLNNYDFRLLNITYGVKTEVLFMDTYVEWFFEL